MAVAVPFAMVAVGVDAALKTPIRVGIGLAIIAVFVAIELAGKGGDLPQNRRLVPEAVINRGGDLGGFQFGVEMGTGMRTYVPSSLGWMLMAGVVFIGSGAGSVFAGAAGFALGRSLVHPLRDRLGEERWDSEMVSRHRTFVLVLLAALVIAVGVVAFPAFQVGA